MASFSRIKLLVVLWAILETAVFAAVVGRIGLGGAFLVGLITSLAGAGMLKRIGAAAVLRLRTGLPRGGDGSDDLLDGGLRALAAAALLLPGFLSDAVGIALAVPVLRTAIVRRVRGSARSRRDAEPGVRRGPDSIDLAPGEWSSVPRSSGTVVPEP